ncbi:MAG: Ig-like domain-containing protein [Bacteroidales bacterium]|nr:Ig-like domain-containing protein [Bacteroidales bacterium]
MNTSSLVLTEGKSEKLSVTILPTNSSNKKVSWKSSNEAVASVANGVVTANGVGSASITVIAEDGGKSATCKVSVEQSIIAVTGITLDKSQIELNKGESAEIVASIVPSNASDKTIFWESADDEIATVKNGIVTAVDGGSTKITATTQDGGYVEVCYVTVNVPVTNVAINKSSLTMTEGEKQRLVASITPANATNKNVTWESSNTEVVTVSLGVVSAIKPGTATITVTTEDGNKTGKCEITVVERTYPVTGVSLDKTSVSLVKGESTSLTATITPSNATNKNVTWTSSNTAVATVAGGTVSAVGRGSATITVRTQDGEFTATCSVTVTVPVTSVKLDKSSISLTEGESQTLTATISPSDATNKNVSWESSDSEVATVKGGKVTAVKPGTATITVTTEDGNKTASCEVSVKAKVYPVTGVSLDKTTLSMVKGDITTLTATITPSNATNTNVTWTSSNTAVATVINGEVSAVGGGSATITVKTQDGGFTATCEVSVFSPVTVISLDKTSETLRAGQSVTLTATVTPDDATDKTVTWYTSDASVATVKNGVVKALKVGTATITATAGEKSAECKITVEPTPVTGITLDKTSETLRAGQSVTLSATVTPDDATDKTVTWYTSDASVATVKNGVVKALKVGTATITATVGEMSAECEITVEPTPVTGISLDKTSYTMFEGQIVTLVATVTPRDATDKTVTWSSSDTSVAAVSDGVVKALIPGSVVITAACAEFEATCTITVKQVDVMNLSSSAIEVDSNGGATEITISSNITWEISSDSSWCTVSPTSGSGNGSFTITTSRNMTNSKRVATITVIGNGDTDLINKKVTVTQLKDVDNGIGAGDWENRGED